MTDEIGIRDQDPWRFIVGPEFTDRFARLDKERLVIFELAQRTDEAIEAFPISRRSAGAATDNQAVRCFRHFRIKVVHQHAHGCLLVPALTTALGATRGANRSFAAHNVSCSLSNSPVRMADAIAALSGARARSSTNGAACFRTAA